MRTFRVVLAAAAAAMIGCSGASSGGGAITTTLTSCDPSTQWTGTYLVHFDVVSGNCGPIPDELTMVDGAGGAATMASTNGCQGLDAMASDGNCRVDGQSLCPGGIHVTGYLVQQTANGSSIIGEETLSAPSCAGTYRVTYTRQ
jgi:hypothetical protein